MPERIHDIRAEGAELVRRYARIDLKLAKILDHFGIPQPTDEEIERALAAEGITPPVKSPATSTGQLSTGESVVHRRPHNSPSSRKEV